MPGQIPLLPEGSPGASLLSSPDGTLPASKDTFHLSAFTVLLVTALLLITMETEVENVKKHNPGSHRE